MDDENKKISDRLWNVDVNAKSYEGASEKYQIAILEQYKLYVEMADRISNRRGLTNTFFLTLNTVIFTIIGVFWKDGLLYHHGVCCRCWSSRSGNAPRGGGSCAPTGNLTPPSTRLSVRWKSGSQP
jgi:hypothetical protein